MWLFGLTKLSQTSESIFSVEGLFGSRNLKMWNFICNKIWTLLAAWNTFNAWRLVWFCKAQGQSASIDARQSFIELHSSMAVGELTCKPCGLIFFFHQNWSWKVETMGLKMGVDERLQPKSWFTDISVEGSCEHSQNQVEQTVMQCWEIYQMVLGLEVIFFCFQFVQLQPIWVLYCQVEKAIYTSEWVPKDVWSFHPSDIVQKIIFVQTALCPGSTMGVDCMYHLALHVHVFWTSLDVRQCYSCRTITWVSIWKLKMLYPLSWSLTCMLFVSVLLMTFDCDSCMKHIGRH